MADSDTPREGHPRLHADIPVPTAARDLGQGLCWTPRRCPPGAPLTSLPPLPFPLSAPALPQGRPACGQPVDGSKRHTLAPCLPQLGPQGCKEAALGAAAGSGPGEGGTHLLVFAVSLLRYVLRLFQLHFLELHLLLILHGPVFDDLHASEESPRQKTLLLYVEVAPPPSACPLYPNPAILQLQRHETLRGDASTHWPHHAVGSHQWYPKDAPTHNYSSGAGPRAMFQNEEMWLWCFSTRQVLNTSFGGKNVCSPG